jgi:hypothetical protein
MLHIIKAAANDGPLPFTATHVGEGNRVKMCCPSRRNTPMDLIKLCLYGKIRLGKRGAMA